MLIAAVLALLQSRLDSIDFDLATTLESRAREAPIVEMDPCAGMTDGSDIVVCGRRDRDRYRLPFREFAPEVGTREWMSAANQRYQLYNHGNSGIGSCSTVGPGGWTGCMAQQWREDRLQNPGGIAF